MGPSHDLSDLGNTESIASWAGLENLHESSGPNVLKGPTPTFLRYLYLKAHKGTQCYKLVIKPMIRLHDNDVTMDLGILWMPTGQGVQQQEDQPQAL